MVGIIGVVIGAAAMMIWRIKYLERRNLELAKKIHNNLVNSELAEIRRSSLVELVRKANERARRNRDQGGGEGPV